MALELKDIKPTILGGVSYKESPIFIDNRGHLKEFLNIELEALMKKKSKKYNFEVSTREGTIVVSLQIEDNKRLLLGVNENGITFQEKDSADFSFFKEDIPILLYSILKRIERNKVELVGMMFKIDPLPLKKDIEVIPYLTKKKYPSFKDELSNLEIVEQEVDRLGFELRFVHNSYLRHLIISVDKKEQANEALISLDTRIDKDIIKKETDIKDYRTLSEFFEKTALSYFLDNVVNGFAKDIFEPLERK